MGADLHAFVEYRYIDEIIWYSFCHPHLDRNYNMFNLLANVRGKDTVFQPKGIPSDISWETKKHYTIRINDELNDKNIEGYTSQESANKWLKYRLSVMWDDGSITDPDAHTPSWLTLEEYNKVIDEYNKEYNCFSKITNYMAVQAAMQVLAQEYQTRIVFWFDN